MISIITGPPGNGKSLLVQSDTIEEFVFGERDIITSTPVRIEPWVTQDGRGMVGLRHYLRLNFPGKELEGELPLSGDLVKPGIVAFGRVLVVEDEEELSTLFLWRRDFKTGKWFKVWWDKDAERFDEDDWKRVRPSVVVTDEAWKCYNSRRWKDTEKVVEFYGRQHRKFGDDWMIVSHSHKDLDVQLNRMAQQWKVCTNYGLRRLSVFRQPAVFEVKTFYEAPASITARCFHTAVTRLNPMIVQTYDTSAGVAVGGGRSADVKRRQKGISPYWILVGLLMVFAALWFFPHLASTGLFGIMKRSAGVPVAKRVVPVAPSRPPPDPVEFSNAVVNVVRSGSNRLFMTGYSLCPVVRNGDITFTRETTVYLSDGSEWVSGDGHLSYLCPRYCVVDGVTNYLRRVQQYAPDLSSLPVVSPAGSSDDNGGSVGSSVYQMHDSREFMQHPSVRSSVGYSQTF